MQGLPTRVYRSSHRPPLQTHALWLITDAFVEFLISEMSPPRTLPILTNHYCTPLTNEPFILFNTEQLTVPKHLETFLVRARQPDIQEIWDYSAVNVAILQSHGLHARHVPVQTTPQRIAYVQSLLRTEPKLYDCGLCGVAPDRRLSIVQELSKRGVKVLLMTSLYGPERDKQLARCKFQLNIHQTDDHCIFESTRCDPWLEAGQPIVSEESLDNDPRCITVPYDKLVDTAVKLKEQYSRPIE